jgi:hypothetical protein
MEMIKEAEVSVLSLERSAERLNGLPWPSRADRCGLESFEEVVQ